MPTIEKKPSSSDVSTKAQIRRLLVVLGAAILLACLAAGVMLAAYGPTGHYRLGNVLLSPTTLQTVTFQRSPFDHIEYTRWDPTSRLWERRTITLSDYQKFYSQVEGLQSELAPEIARRNFDVNHPTLLTLYVHPQEDVAGTRARALQTVEFANDYFRVELQVQGSENNLEWVYFYQPGLEELLKKTFALPEVNK